MTRLYTVKAYSDCAGWWRVGDVPTYKDAAAWSAQLQATGLATQIVFPDYINELADAIIASGDLSNGTDHYRD